MQLSFMDAVDAALTTGFPCGSWWWSAWKAGDPLPPGWRPPVPGADNPKPRREAGSPPGTACEGDEIDVEIAKALDAWLPAGMVTPFVGIHQTRRLACGGAWACLEAWDGGLSHATVRDGVIDWGHVPGAGPLVPLEGRWTRLQAEEEAQDAHWKEPGDAIPRGYTPPIAEEVLPGWDASLDGMRDRQSVSDVMEFLLSRFPPGIPFPWEGVVETHRYPDGAVWASLPAVHDGGPCHVTLRDGVMVWSEAPGYGLLTYLRETSTWGRLPATETCDAEAPAAASALPDVVVPETEPSASPDVEAIETSASDLPDVAPVAALQPSGGIAAFLHATHLATDASWKGLAVSLSRTTPGDVRNAVARHVSGGSLSAANAAALLARLDAAEAPAEDVAPEAEVPDVDSDVDPVYGTRPVPRASPDFLEKLLEKHEAIRRARHERWKPLEALEEAGLATIQRQGERGTKSFQCHIALAPAVSDAMTLWFFQAGGYPENVTLLLAPDTDPDSEIVRSVTAILGLGVTVRPAESPRPATGDAG